MSSPPALQLLSNTNIVIINILPRSRSWNRFFSDSDLPRVYDNSYQLHISHITSNSIDSREQIQEYLKQRTRTENPPATSTDSFCPPWSR